MFGISLPELLVVFAVILLVFGPDKLPEIAKTLGKLMADLRRTSDSVRREFYNNVYPPTNEANLRLSDASRELRAIKNEIETGLKTPEPPTDKLETKVEQK